eukprot:6111546-Amphidinium_carterae.1
MAAFGPVVLERPREDLLACGIVQVPQQLFKTKRGSARTAHRRSNASARTAAESSLASMPCMR